MLRPLGCKSACTVAETPRTVGNPRRFCTRQWFAPLVLAGALTLGVVIVAQSTPARAADFQTNSLADAVDVTPGDGVCLTASGVCTLRAAIMEANALPGPDTVRLIEGIHQLEFAGPSEDDGAVGDLDVLDDLELIGQGIGKTTISGGFLDRVLHVPNLQSRLYAVRLVIQGLTIKEGREELPYADGAGLRAEAAEIVVRNAAIVENDGRGAFLDLSSWSADSTFEDCEISRNSGGGLSLVGASASVINCTFDSNGSPNSVVNGAGILSQVSGVDQPVLSISGSRLTRNDAGGGWGGALSINETLFSMSSSVVADNAARRGGGAVIYTDEAPESQIRRSSFVRNRASEDGGGIVTAHPAILLLENSTVGENTAGGSGGGIFVDSTDLLVAVGSTIAKNTAGGVLSQTAADEGATRAGGGGLFVLDDSQVSTLKGTIIASNGAPLGPDCLVAFPVVAIESLGAALVSDLSDCAFQVSATDILGDAASPVNARLFPLTTTDSGLSIYRLGRASPAVDAWPVSICTTGLAGYPEVALDTDQRGAQRPQGQACDIGAYEATPTAPGPSCGLGPEVCVTLAALLLIGRRRRKVAAG